MELKNINKKFKNKIFAFDCSRDTFKQGAEILDWDISALFQKTMPFMCSCEDFVRAEGVSLTGHAL